jgi:tetratricopeptide (TPR) repeat protein
MLKRKAIDGSGVRASSVRLPSPSRLRRTCAYEYLNCQKDGETRRERIKTFTNESYELLLCIISGSLRSLSSYSQFSNHTNFEHFCFLCWLSIVLNQPSSTMQETLPAFSFTELPCAPFMDCSPPINTAEEERALRHSTAIRLSNYGVALMEQGQHAPAVDALGRALKMCRNIMDEAEDDDVPWQTMMSTSLDACMEASRLAWSTCCSNNNQADSSRLTRGERYLYQQAIRIPLTVGSNYRACVMLTTMVTFNLALAKQLTASSMMQADDYSRSMMLRKASKLYELAFSMQQEEEFDQNTLFTLATVNNLGLIHSQLKDSHAADQCFEYLLSTLMYLTNSNAGGGRPAFLDGFFRNATTLIQKSQSAPAA